MSNIESNFAMFMAKTRDVVEMDLKATTFLYFLEAAIKEKNKKHRRSRRWKIEIQYVYTNHYASSIMKVISIRITKAK